MKKIALILLLSLKVAASIQAQSFKKVYKTTARKNTSADWVSAYKPFMHHKKYSVPAHYYTAKAILRHRNSMHNCMQANTLLLEAEKRYAKIKGRRKQKLARKYDVNRENIAILREEAQRWTIAYARAMGTLDALDTLKQLEQTLESVVPDIEETYTLIVNSRLEATGYAEMSRLIKEFAPWIKTENYSKSRQIYQRLWPTFKTEFGACLMDRYALDFPASTFATDCWKAEVQQLFCSKNMGKMLDFFAQNPYSALEVSLITEISAMDKFGEGGVDTLPQHQRALLNDIQLRNAIIQKFRGKTVIRDSAELVAQANRYIQQYAPRYSAYQMLDEGLDYFIENQKYAQAVSFLSQAQPFFPDSLPPGCKSNYPFQLRVQPYIRGKLKILQQDSKKVRRSPVAGINTPGGREFSPVLSPDGQELYFAGSGRLDNIHASDVFKSRFQDGAWSRPEVVRELSGKGDQIPCAVSPNGKSMLILLNGKLCLSKKKSQQWTIPEPLPISGIAWTGRGVFAGNADTILLEGSYTPGTATQAPDKDIFVCYRDGVTGQWTTPAGLGSDINTDEQESHPFLSGDGRRLYYCSSGYPGLGGSDLFVSERLKRDWVHWSPPKNLGKSINDTQHYNGLVFSDNTEKRAFFSKFWEENSDIWLIEFID